MTSTPPQPASLALPLTESSPSFAHPSRAASPCGQSRRLKPVTLCWDLATRAGTKLLAQTRAEQSPGHAAVAVELTIEPTQHNPLLTAVRLCALLRSGDTIELQHLTNAHARWSSEAGFDHIDIEGVVSCTFRTHAVSSRPLYARCPLLTTLGIPAGAYALRTGHL